MVPTQIAFSVEKRRVLVPVGEPCPFGCRYCYTRNGEVGGTRVEENEILARFSEFARAHDDEFETIQFGYDGDPFARPERGVSMLRQLATMGKNLNFSTKALLSDTTLTALGEIRSQMEERGTVLSALISVSCWDSAARVEPHTPTPQARLQTAWNLKRSGIPTFIVIRPILPHIADEEYARLIEQGIRVGCDGFILGPLYADEEGRFVRFIPEERLASVPYRRTRVSWSPHTPIWRRYEKESRLRALTLLIQELGGQVFVSSADAMKIVRQERIAV